MISLDRNLSETWTAYNNSTPQTKNNSERADFLTFQLQKIVDKIQTGDVKSLEATVSPPPWLQSGLKRICRLRAHHIKILTHISASGSMRDLILNPTSTRTLVTAAAKSVDLHLEIANAGEISPLVLSPTVNLLLSSLAIMMFVVSHFPEGYGPLCSKPFQTAIQILSDLESCVKERDLNIQETLHILEKIVETSQRSASRQSNSLVSGKDEIGNTVDPGEAFCEGSVFEELPTPDPEFFSLLGSRAAADILHLDNLFG